jgi:DNA-binding transcriptional regulator/RsmH inhibitor MraZ
MNGLYHGSELCDVDADGNVAIPAFLEEALAPETDPEIIVARHQADACLIGYDRGHIATLAARAERLRQAEEARGEEARAHYRRMRGTFGLSERMNRNAKSLRIPAAMRHLGRIEDLALFVGAGDNFEIWNPMLALESDDEQFRALAEFRLRMRGKKTSKGVH